MSERLPDGRSTGLTPDELDRLIDGLVAGAHDAADPDATVHAYALLSTAREIRDLADEPIPADVRSRHLATIRQATATRTAPATSDRATSGWLVGFRRRATAIAAATGLAFTATGGGAIAVAQGANPDDALYGLKRASENVALAVTRDDARLHLEFAERRLDELEAAPGHAGELATAAARQLGLAQEHGADLGEAGAQAVARLTELANDPAKLGSDNARIAVARACDRIAQRNPDVDNTCGYEDESPGTSGDAPGRQDDGQSERGNRGDAPRHQDDGPAERGDRGDAPDRSGDAPRGGNDTSVDPEGTDRDDDPGPPDEVRGNSDGAPGSGS